MKNWSLIIVWSLVLGAWSIAAAMGGSPPEKPKEESKYKLEIIKMDMISGTPEAKTLTTQEGQSKYKLEILKMDVITSPSPSCETKSK